MKLETSLRTLGNDLMGIFPEGPDEAFAYPFCLPTDDTLNLEPLTTLPDPEAIRKSALHRRWALSKMVVGGQ
jgi:hypothetical protein